MESSLTLLTGAGNYNVVQWNGQGDCRKRAKHANHLLARLICTNSCRMEKEPHTHTHWDTGEKKRGRECLWEELKSACKAKWGQKEREGRKERKGNGKEELVGRIAAAAEASPYDSLSDWTLTKTHRHTLQQPSTGAIGNRGVSLASQDYSEPFLRALLGLCGF